MASVYGRTYSFTHERLKEMVNYDPETGIFTWRKKNPKNHFVKPGDICGHLNKDGYIVMSIDSVRCKAHRVAWFYMTGKWPKKLIDHKNRIKSDNRFCNLRECNVSQNKINGAMNKNNTSGFRGVYRRNGNGRYRTKVRKGNKTVWFGPFDTPEEAYKVYLRENAKLHGEFIEHS
jgi:hypothetical protein